jgi:hypothetical protein
MTEGNFSSRTVSASVRPSRLAILINRNDQEWQESCLRIIERTSQIWGGWYSCIVPTDGQTISEPFWFLLRKFDPDYIYTYEAQMLDLKISKPSTYERWATKQIDAAEARNPGLLNEETSRSHFEEQLEQLQRINFNVADELSNTLLKRLNPFHDPSRAISGSFSARNLAVGYPLTSIQTLFPHLAEPLNDLDVLDVEVDGTLPVKLMIHALTGKLWPGLVESIKLSNIPVFQEVWSRQTLREKVIGLGTGKIDPVNHLPRRLSLINCHLYSSVHSREWEQPSVVIVGDTLDDFCAYYNLLRMRRNVSWLPVSLLASYENKTSQQGSRFIPYEEEEILVTELAHHLDHQVRFDRPSSKIVISSLSASPSELQRIGTVLSDARWVNTEDPLTTKMSFSSDLSGFLPATLRLYEGNNVDRFYRELFDKGESINFLNTPKPQTFKTVHPYDHRWITELRVEKYVLPAKSELGPATISQLNYSSNECRVTKEGFAYFCPNCGYFGGDIDTVLVRPKLCIHEPFQVFTKIFQPEGLTICLSDKGNYHMESVSKFDSLESLSLFLKDPLNKALLDLYLEESPSTLTTGALVRDRRYLDFVAVRTILQDPKKTGDLLSDLVARQILSRGLVLFCERCRNSDWYSIDDIGHTFTCSRCRKAEIYTKVHWKSPEEPNWYYRLDEVFYQGYRHQMSVPILTLDLLRRSTKVSFFYSPEIEIRSDPTTKDPDLELDFACCLDGQLVIGQATVQDRLSVRSLEEKTRLVKNRDVAKAIGASVFILSTLSETWNAHTVGKADEVFQGSNVQVRYVTQADLLSK